MKNRYRSRTPVLILLMAVVALAQAMWPQVGRGQETAAQQDPWANYEIILKRNIFSRQRRPARQIEENSQARNVVVPNPESYFLLKGIVQEDNQFPAFIEDTQGGSVLRLRQGDRVARGAIKALSLDAIEYELESRTSTIRLGYDLEGGHGAVTAGQLQEWSQTPAPAGPQVKTGQEQAPSGDEAEILRRLMEQRKQQLGQ
jgi:hypothetical protein